MMMNIKKAIYAASLDPITNGHLWVIKQGLKLFDHLIIAIGINPAKSNKYLFSDLERVKMARSCVEDRCSVIPIGKQYIVDFAKNLNCSHLLRGARNESDFSSETLMANINRKMALERGFDIETIILTPPPEISCISSSFVKSLTGYHGWQEEIKQYVPEQVCLALMDKIK